MSILKTTDYTIFKRTGENRELNEHNIKRLMDSMTAKNKLGLKPIIVNKEMAVVDGQHRLEAARRLQLEVSYRIDEDSASEDIILFNANQKTWLLTDYMNYYCKLHYAEYLELKKFCKETNLSIMQARALMTEYESFTTNFKTGKFQFPKNDRLARFNDRYNNLKFVQEYIEMKLPKTKICYKGSIFIHALLDFFNNKNVDISVFLEKLEYKLDVMRPATSRMGYMAIFKEIYNWKNKNSIE